MPTIVPTLTYHALLDQQRQSNGLSYQHLAERAWITANCLHCLCRSDVRPGYTIVRRLAIAMALMLDEVAEMLREAGYPPLLAFKAPIGAKLTPN